MDENVENNNSGITYLWSRDEVRKAQNEVFSDDPLEDLINEFGTETKTGEEFNVELEQEFSTMVQDDDAADDPLDYFYSQRFNDAPLDEADKLEALVKRTKYLSHKLKYYNTFLLNKR